MKMHTDEVEIDAGLVRRLLESQFPQWAALPLERVLSMGTDNVLYRLGDAMVVRLPRVPSAVDGLEKELAWLPFLAPQLPVEVPVPLARGSPADGYPLLWAVYGWLGGRNPTIGDAGDANALVRDSVAFIRALHRVDPCGPAGGRRSLAPRNDAVRDGLAALQGTIDVKRAQAVWEEALSAPAWTGDSVWTHGDLLPGNLLVRDGRLTGVIDWSVAGIGEPACDMLIAWSLLPGEGRRAFRDELRVDEATWARGRAWALAVGVVGIPYYKETNPAFAAMGRYLLDEVLAERDGDR